MDDQAFELLVRRLEVDAQVHPARFRTKVFLVSIAGYVALLAAMAAVALYMVLVFQYLHGWLAGKLLLGGLLVGAPLYYIVLKTFLTRLPAPEGRRITEKEAPKLFEAIGKIRSRLNGPRISHVLIDMDFNAAIVQHPRFGMFGGHTNYLILGLPFMLAMSAEEMLAVIAHEYGHICGDHGKLSAWIFRQRRTVFALKRSLDEKETGWADGMLLSGLERYMPWFAAYTFVLSRQNEYEADRAAVSVSGAPAQAAGLVRSALAGRWFGEDFWSTLYKHAETADTPPVMPYASMAIAFKAAHGEWATQERLDAAWSEKSDLTDTHPALRERLDASGQAPALPAMPSVSAADILLGSKFGAALRAEFDSRWWEERREPWQERYRYVQRSRARMAELAEQPGKAMPMQDVNELALLTCELDSLSEARALLERLMADTSASWPAARLAYGRLKLADGERKGLDYLLEAARANGEFAVDAARAGYFYLRAAEGEAEAEKWWGTVMAHQR